MSAGQDIVDRLAARKQELENACNDIYIVNAGRMNHGKSSLMNSIFERMVFKEADIRETRKNQVESYAKHVYLIDTPGLDADAEDNAAAFDVYKKANFILFVHNPKTGEFHESAWRHMDAIAYNVGKKYLVSHLAIVLTHREELEKEQLAAIQGDIEHRLAERFPDAAVPIFRVSNARFKKAQKETDARKKEAFLANSGIPQLKAYIEEHIPAWLAENRDVQRQRFDDAKKMALAELQKARKKQEDALAKKRQKSREKLQWARGHVDKLQGDWAEIEGRLDQAEHKRDKAKKKIRKLLQQYKSEHYGDSVSSMMSRLGLDGATEASMYRDALE